MGRTKRVRQLVSLFILPQVFISLKIFFQTIQAPALKRGPKQGLVSNAAVTM